MKKFISLILLSSITAFAATKQVAVDATTNVLANPSGLTFYTANPVPGVPTLIGANIFTGLNTFQNNPLIVNSSDNTTYYSETDYTFTGLAEKGRVQMEHVISGTDNPHTLHSSIFLSLNYNAFTGLSDDGTGIFNYLHPELRYEGNSVGTITSIVTSAGVGTFTVNSTSALCANRGIRVWSNSVSSNNAYWKIVSVTNSTTFTAVLSSGTATTGTGTGGDIRAEGNELNAAFNGYRWWAVAARNGNVGFDGGISFNYPTSIAVPTNFACLGGNEKAAFLIAGAQSSTSGADGMYLWMSNSDTTSARAGFGLHTSKSGKFGFDFLLDPLATGLDDVRITQGGGTPMSFKGSRGIFGATEASDDGVTQNQFIGTTKAFNGLTVAGATSTTTLAVTSTSAFTGAAALNGGGTATGSFDVADSSGGHALQGTSTNVAITARVSAVANSSERALLTCYSSKAASPTSYTETLDLFSEANGSGDATAMFLFCRSGVSNFYLGINGSGIANSYQFGTSLFVLPSAVTLYVESGVINTDAATLTIAKKTIITGTATNDDAASGKVGEYIASTVVAGSAVSLTTATTANVTSISLTAGDWDVSYDVYFIETGVTATQFDSSISTTSATLSTTPGEFVIEPSVATGLTGTKTHAQGAMRKSLASTTTVYLPAKATFSLGTISAYGIIRARRVR